MNYKALDIAEYVISKCNEGNIPITNLKLQKILYYIQAYSLVLLDDKMFREEIRAWTYGPVVKEVYDEYSHYAAFPINRTTEFQLSDKREIDVVRRVFLDKISIDAWDLVEQTHNEDPWKETIEMFGEGAIIPCELIKDYFEDRVKR